MAWSPFLLPTPLSSCWVHEMTPSTWHTELEVSKTPSQCCNVGHPGGLCLFLWGATGSQQWLAVERVLEFGVSW